MFGLGRQFFRLLGDAQENGTYLYLNGHSRPGRFSRVKTNEPGKRMQDESPLAGLRAALAACT